MVDFWCFPYASEGKARRCASLLIEQGFDDVDLHSRGGTWHVALPADSDRLGEAKFFLTGKGITGAPRILQLV